MSTPPDQPAQEHARALRLPRRSDPEARMSLVDHIRELRSRLLKAVFGLALGMIVGWIFFTPVWHFLEKPYCRIPQHNRLIVGHGCQLIVNGLFDGFFLHLKIMFVVGLIVSSPIWLYQVWAFVAPGLYALVVVNALGEVLVSFGSPACGLSEPMWGTWPLA